MSGKDLNSFLVELDDKSSSNGGRTSVSNENTEISVERDRQNNSGNLVQVPQSDVEQTDIINRFKAGRLKSKKELEAAKLVYDTQLEKL